MTRTRPKAIPAYYSATTSATFKVLDTLTYTLVSGTSEGTAVVNTDGSYTFDPGSDFQDLALGETRDVTFTYRVSDDGVGNFNDEATVTITVTGTNDTPDISVQAGDSAAETLAETNTTLTSTGTLSVTDVDLTDTVASTVSSVVASGTTTGLGSNNAALLAMLSSTANVLDGTETTDTLTWAFNSGSEAFDYLAVGESLTLTYTITVTDSQGATDTQDVVITINGTNDAPVVTVEVGDSVADTLTETNTTLTSSGTLTLSDLDLSDAVSSTVSSVVAGGSTTGLQSNNTALLAMLSSTANVIDGTELTDALNWAFNSGSEAFNYLAVGESLTLTYTITVTDSQGATDTQDVVITINGTNDAPVVTVETGDSAAATLTESNTTLTSTGTFTVTDVDLTDTVTSTVSSVVASGTTTGLGSNNTALLAMLSSTGNVLDGTKTSDTLTWAFNSGSQAFDYLAIGDSLTLTYTITVTDSQGVTDTQDVVITINGTNDDPVLTIEVADSAAETLTETDTTLTSSGTLSVEDLDLSDSVTSTVSSVVASGGATGLSSNNAALLAMLTSTANVIDGSELTNTLTWNFNSASEAFDYLAVGESLTLTYTITVTDSQGATDTQDVVITINGTNDAPVAQAGTNLATEDGATINGQLTETDADTNDTHTYSLITNTSEGTAIVNSDGSYTFNPGSDFQDLAFGNTRDVTFVYEVTDNNGATSQATVTISVSGTNDAPVAQDGTNSATEDGSTINGQLTETDLDTIDTHTYSLVTNTSEGTAVVNSDGSYTFNPGSDFQALAFGETRDVSFVFEVTDNNGATSQATVTITVTGTNDAPVISGGPGASSLTETNAGLTDSGAFTVTDLDTTDNVSAAVDSLVVGGTGVGSVPASLTNTVLADFLSVTPTAILNGVQSTNTLTWNFNSGSEAFDFLATGETLVLTYTVSVTDDNGVPLSDTETITVTITGTNDEQIVTINTGTTVMENATGNVIASSMLATTDLDNNVPGLLYTITGTTNNGVLRLNGVALSINDTFTQDDINNNRLTYDHDGSETTSDSFAFSVDDGEGSVSNGSFAISVTLVNDNTPVIDINQTLFIAENSNIGASVGFVSASDVDLNTTFVNWQIVGGNTGGVFTIDSVTGEVLMAIFGPDIESQATYSLEIQTSDGVFTSASQWITIQVIDINEAPVALNDTYSTIIETDVRLSVPTPVANDTDVDGDSLFVVIVSGPANGVLTVDGDGVLRYRPNPGFFGTETITYRASDGNLQSNLATISIIVQAVGTGGGGGGSGSDTGGGGGDTDGGGDTGDGSGNSGDDSGTGGISTDGLGGTGTSNPVDQQNDGTQQGSNDEQLAIQGDRSFGMHQDQDIEATHANSVVGTARAEINLYAIESRINFTLQSLEQLLQLDMNQSIAWNQWNELLDSKEEDRFDWEASVGAVGVTAGLVSIGYVFWAIRGTLFLATVYSGLPTWRMIDPAALLTAYSGSQTGVKDRIDDIMS